MRSSTADPSDRGLRGAEGLAARNIEEVEFPTLEWVDWFNHRRLLEPIRNIPPAEFEAMYFQHQEALAMGAGLT